MPSSQKKLIIKKIWNVIKKTIATVLVAVCIVLFVAFASVLIQLARKENPTLLGYRLYYILTDSMEPDLQVHDSILSKTFKTVDSVREELEVGDVVTFFAAYGSQKGMLITHSVVRTAYFNEYYGREVIDTKGTKENAPLDPPVPIENVQAKMVVKLSVLGSFYSFIINGNGIIYFIVIPTILIFGISIFQMSMQVRKVNNSQRTEEEIAQEAVRKYKKAEKKNIKKQRKQHKLDSKK